MSTNLSLHLNDQKVFATIPEERARRLATGSEHVSETEKEFLLELKKLHRTEPVLSSALKFAKNVPYERKGNYLSHPLRLAITLLRFEPKIDVHFIVVALIHNVLEASTIKPEELHELFGPEITGAIQILTVPRDRRLLNVEKLYRGIFSHSKELSLIKLLDKMDNIFVLDTNPNEEIKTNYVAEIRKYLSPFANEYHPDVGSYLEAMLDFALEKK